MKKINLKFFTFLSIILLIGVFSLPSAAQVPHTVYGNLRYSNNEIPNSINFSAYIITRPLDSLTVTSRHCGYNKTSGQWYVQCAEFNSSWSPGESLIIEFNDGNISTGADTVQLSSDPYDNADTTTLYKPFRYIVIKTTPPDLNFTVDGKEYNHENIFKWEQESSHTLSIADVQYEGEMIKYDFEAWNNGGKQTQKYVVSTSDDTLIALCKTNYLLELNSKHGNPEGEGWYLKNETAFISIQSQEIIQKTKYLFNYWSGNLSSTDTSLIITMDTPKSLTAYWSIQHYLTLNSSHGNPQGEGWYNKNSQANFYVTTPDLKGKTRYIFQSWSGDYSGQFYNATILMDTSKTIQAGWNTEYYLTLEKNPDLGGTITPSPPGMWTEENEQIQISATPKTTYVFSKWTGDIEITENPTWLNMTTPLDVTAEFLKIVDITITTNPPQQTIIIDGIEYTAPKTFKWVESTIHSITVKSPVYTEKDTRYIFDSWSNGGEINQSYVVSDQNETIIGSLKKQYHLTVDSEHGYPKGTGWYDINTEANFSVTNPDIQGATRYIFKEWSGNYYGTNPSSSIIMSSPKTVSASWEVQYYLSVRNSGHGIVTGEGWYDQGQTATFSLYATNVSEGEGTRYIFSNWEGTGDGSYTGENQSHSVVMNNPIIEKVEWILQYFLYTQVNPALGGNISPAPPGNWYTVNEEAEITATPAPSYKFLFWTGDILGTTNPKTRIITEPTSVTANFSQLIEVTINTNPAGITFTADGEKYTSPHKFTWIKNSTHTIAADSIFSVDTGIRYTYNQWNHGEPREHVFTVPDDNTIITADYKLQYYLTIDSEDGNPKGEGWYFNGAKAEFSVDEFIIQGFTKKTFNRWTGDYMGYSNSGTVFMNRPKIIIPIWDTEYFIEIISDYGITTGQGWYPKGTQVTFSVSPAVQTLGDTIKHIFIQWKGTGDGSYTGTNMTYTLILNNPMIEKVVWETKYFLSTSIEPASAGKVTPASPGAWFNKNAVVNISATSKNEYFFSHWSGDIENEVNPGTISMDKPKQIKAIFGLPTGIIIDTNPTGLKFTADDIEYTAPHTFDWTEQSSHTLSVPSPQDPETYYYYEFSSWSNEKPQQHIYTVPSNKDTITANFQPYYYLTVYSSYGTPQGSGWYKKDTQARISLNKQVDPDPEDQSRKIFYQWEGDYSGTDTLAYITMDSPKTINASWKTQYFVEVVSERGVTSGQGWYTENTTAHIGVSTPITIDSTSRYSFSAWEGLGDGSYSGSSLSPSISIKNPIVEIAKWGKEYKIQTAVKPQWGGIVSFSPSGPWHKAKTYAVVTAVPDTVNNYIFSSWSGDLTSTRNPETLYIEGPQYLTANFNTTENTLITTDPLGLPVTVDGTTYESPIYFNWSYGTSHVISVPSLYKPNNDVKYLFLSWDDKGDTTHTIDVGEKTTYKAVFKTQYFLHIQINPANGGIVSPSEPGTWFNKGVNATINATASEGYRFSYWSGSINNQTNPILTIMDQSKSVIAHFEKTTDIKEKTYSPDKFILAQNYPNPFNPQTTIEYHIPQSSHIQLMIANTTGQIISILVDTFQEAGKHSTTWNGKDDLGNPVSSGIYYYILKNENNIKIKKLLFLK